MKANPRQLAILILCRQQETTAPLDQVRDTLIKETTLESPQDYQLAAALVYGVLRWQRFLDGILADFSRHPLAKMKQITLQSLRVGLYQLVFMDRVPPSAAVNETVKALRSLRQPKWLTGFVNGVLRTISREIDRLPDPWQEGRFPAAVRLSHPDWLFSRWEERYGHEEAVRICSENNRQAPLTLRVNTRRLSRQMLLERLADNRIQAQAAPHAPEAILLTEYKHSITGLPGYHAGHFMVQDEGAQLITHMLAPFPAGRYLDACAGLGGKTVQLAQLIPAESELIAVEPHAGRSLLLKENLERNGLDRNVTVIHTDLENFAREKPLPFHAVLIDAPCSGLGVVRRNPDIRWNRSLRDIKRYCRKQLDLLCAAAPLLAGGGVLVYATCSMEPEENEEVVAAFLRKFPGFSPAYPDDFPETARPLLDEQGCLHTRPQSCHDGFFAARLEKRR